MNDEAFAKGKKSKKKPTSASTAREKKKAKVEELKRTKGDLKDANDEVKKLKKLDAWRKRNTASSLTKAYDEKNDKMTDEDLQTFLKTFAAETGDKGALEALQSEGWQKHTETKFDGSRSVDFPRVCLHCHLTPDNPEAFTTLCLYEKMGYVTKKSLAGSSAHMSRNMSSQRGTSTSGGLRRSVQKQRTRQATNQSTESNKI